MASGKPDGSYSTLLGADPIRTRVQVGLFVVVNDRIVGRRTVAGSVAQGAVNRFKWFMRVLLAWADTEQLQTLLVLPVRVHPCALRKASRARRAVVLARSRVGSQRCFAESEAGIDAFRGYERT